MIVVVELSPQEDSFIKFNPSLFYSFLFSLRESSQSQEISVIYSSQRPSIMLQQLHLFQLLRHLWKVYGVKASGREYGILLLN